MLLPWLVVSHRTGNHLERVRQVFDFYDGNANSQCPPAPPCPALFRRSLFRRRLVQAHLSPSPPHAPLSGADGSMLRRARLGGCGGAQ